MLMEAHVYREGFAQYRIDWYWEGCLPAHSLAFTKKGAIKEVMEVVASENKPYPEPVFSYVQNDAFGGLGG